MLHILCGRSPCAPFGMDLVHVGRISRYGYTRAPGRRPHHVQGGPGVILSSPADGGIEVVGRSSSGGEDAIALIKKNTPDVVVTQIDADLKTAKDVLFRIRSASPHSRIVVLTIFD